jgi:hypothetical protein
LNRSVAEENFGNDFNQTEHFTNHITLNQPLNEIDNDRRVPWLRTVPSQGIRSRQKDKGADTTLDQIVGGSNNETGNVPRNVASSDILSQTIPPQFNETFRSEEDLAQSEADISTYPNRHHTQTGWILYDTIGE